MPVNLEIKLKIENPSLIEKSVKKSGANFLGLLDQKDIYYKYRKGLLKLRVENGSNWLIKYLRDEKGIRWSNYELLKLEGKNVETYLSDFLEVKTVVEKKRKLYMYKNTRIHLDKVKRLGNYLELETVVKRNKKSAQKEFNEVVKLLNLNEAKQIKSSYAKLLGK